MKELEANVCAIEKEGLVWGASKLVAVGFGIKKLQINLVVEDEKVSLDQLQGQVEEDEDHVQSTDSSIGCYAKVVDRVVCLFFSLDIWTFILRLHCHTPACS